MAARKSGKAKAPGRPRLAILPHPSADETCSLSRTVEVADLRLEIWNCSDPRPLIRVKMTAHRFPTKYTRVWWPGSLSAWYDAHYYPDELSGLEGCIPGRTQYVVYEGGGAR
jgi:hypothetical protein